MAIYPSGTINQAGITRAVGKARKKLNKNEVRGVGYTIGVDSTGETSIFFRILLSDAASRESRLGDVTTRVGTILSDELRPYERFGVLPYFTFRSEAEQRENFDSAWEIGYGLS